MEVFIEQEQLIAFRTKLGELVQDPKIDRLLLEQLLQDFQFPPLSEDLLAQSRKCRAQLFLLAWVSDRWTGYSAHSMGTDTVSLCCCPRLGIMVIKRKSCYQSRTHGHHFREECYSGYQKLKHDEFIEFVLEQKENLSFPYVCEPGAPAPIVCEHEEPVPMKRTRFATFWRKLFRME